MKTTFQSAPTTAPAGQLEAVLFDMDGAVTATTAAHAVAWKQLFDTYLQERAERFNEAFVPFDLAVDYRRYVDGKPRCDGVQSFLASRRIILFLGTPDDAPEIATVYGLSNRKHWYFRAWLVHQQVRPYPSTIALIARLRADVIKTAIFSASRNCQAVLDSAGIASLFDAKVDGSDVARPALPGKPHPTMLHPRSFCT